LVSASSIFSVVKKRDPDEPCFTDGAYVFYEKAVSGRSSNGNSMAALRYIFRHWYVSKVFKEDGKTFQEPFLYLLKLRNFKDKEEELKAIAEDVTLDVNRKFFKLFYTVIYKNQINVFYWHEGDSSLREVPPRFLDKNDFYKKMVSSRNPSEFLMSFEPCFDELIYFLQSGAKQVSTDFRMDESISDIITAVILFFIIGCEFFINYKIVFRKSHKEGK
jgi:hypothetical protein